MRWVLDCENWTPWHAGDFKAQFSAPPKLLLNCTCKSCVACAKYCDDLGTGTSAMTGDGVAVAKAFFELKHLSFDENVVDKLEYMRCGDKGTNIRALHEMLQNPLLHGWWSAF